MNARVIATGEIKSFYPTKEGIWDGYVDENGQSYHPMELDFSNGGIPLPEKESQTDTVWLARDEDGTLIAFSERPVQTPQHSRQGYWSGKRFRVLNRLAFPQITWLSEPIECYVTIRIK